MSDRVLAVVDKICKVFKHPNADSLCIARVQGWDVIINPVGMFGPDATYENIVGRKIVYVQIDSVMPETFKENVLWKYLTSTYMGRRVRSAKIRGVVSQGLILDFNTLGKLFPAIDFASMPEGTNVTDILGVVKFYDIDDPERPDHLCALDKRRNRSSASPASLRKFPEFLVKTDQVRLQAQMDLVRGLTADRRFTATQKYDGQSVQWFVRAGQVGVCSRNFEVNLEFDVDGGKRDKANDKFRYMNNKYGIFDKLKALGRNVSVQTEMYGMGINGNRHELKDVDVAVFDVFDIDRQAFMQHAEVCELAKTLQLPTVAVVFEGQPLLSTEIEPWVELANGQRYTIRDAGEKNNTGDEKAGELLAEGIVVKTSDNNGPYVSFKVISPEYLVKYGL